MNRFLTHPIKRLNITKTKKLAEQLAMPPREEDEVVSDRGEFAFFDIKGMAKLRNTTLSYIFHKLKANGHSNEEAFEEAQKRSAILATEATRFLCSKMSAVTDKDRWEDENYEITDEDTIRMVSELNERTQVAGSID